MKTMKEKMTIRMRAGRLFCATLLLITIAGCDFSGLEKAVDDFGVVIELQPINTHSTVLLTDANTGELITTDVNVTFSGPNGDDVIDIYSDPMPTESVDSGILNFGINNAVTPSENAPATVQVTLEAEGYLTTTRTVSITDVGNSEFLIEMINEDNPPQGYNAGINTSGQAGEDGSVQNNIEVQVNPDNGDSGVTVLIPGGTVFTDAEGNPLTGQLTTEVTYIDPTAPEAFSSVPFELVTEEGDRLYTAGIITLQVTDEQGNRAVSSSSAAKISFGNTASANSNGSVHMSTYIPGNMINLVTGQPFKGGDELMSYQWSREQLGLILSKLLALDVTDGLATSYPDPTDAYSADYLILAQKISEEFSKQGMISIDRSGYNGTISGSVFAPGINETFFISSLKDRSTFFSIPNLNFTYTLNTAYGSFSGIHNFHENGDLNITLPAPPSSLIDSKVVVALQCQNPDEAVSVTDIPGASVVYRKTDASTGTSWSVATNLQWDYDEVNQVLTGGSFDIAGVEQGENYTFKITYDGESYTRDIMVNGTTVNYTEIIKDSICS